MVLARLLKCCSHVVHHRIADVSGDRRANEAAHGDNRNFVRGHARASLQQDLAETRDRLCFTDSAHTLKCGDYQYKVHEQTGTKRHEQKDA